VFSGTSPDSRLVEYIELPREEHPYFVATQAHPELRSRPTRPHPLFAGLIAAAVATKEAAAESGGRSAAAESGGRSAAADRRPSGVVRPTIVAGREQASA